MSQTHTMIRELVDWAESHNTLFDERVYIYQDPVTGLSFRTTQDLPSATQIVNCAYGTTLSYLNAIHASPFFQNHDSEPFPSQFMAALSAEDPNVIGHFLLMQQYLLGEKSFWWPYIRLLPQPDQPETMCIPIWWSEADRAFLNGTNAEPPIKKRKKLWDEEWRRGIDLLRDNLSDWEKYTYILYQWAATIFGSRSFRASLTIPEELLVDDSDESLAQTLDHVRKDRFSVLLPVLDIGNHNGVNQVDWSRDVTAGIFSLSTREPILKGTQVYNYYGDKSNSELLVGYGFILADVSKDRVNLKVTPQPDALLLRRLQACHVIQDSNQPEQEFMFNVRMKPEDQDPYAKVQELQVFSDGLFDTMICMVANRRERSFISQNLNYCPEKDPAVFGGPLSRSAHQVLGILKDKLEYEIARIEDAASWSGPREARNNTQRLALAYRNRQLDVLKAALAGISTRMDSCTSFLQSPHYACSQTTNGNADFLSLEIAFDWLRINYPDISKEVEKIISTDQNEPLPLNWATLVEDWDHTYWVVWIYLVWMLWAQDWETFKRSHHKLSMWHIEMNQSYDYEASKSEWVDTFYADTSEKETIDDTIRAITLLPQFQSVRESMFPDCTKQDKLRNFASFIAQEEIVQAHYKTQVGPQAGEPVPHKLLCINRGTGAQGVAQRGPWLQFLGQIPQAP